MKQARGSSKFIGPLLLTILFLLFIFVLPEHGQSAVSSLRQQFLVMIRFLPPVFILLGLLDAWVPREYLIHHMGPESGIKGNTLAFLLGSAAAGPLYGAFPFAAVLMKKGSSRRNVMIFVGAWSTTKIPMLLFETAALGPRFSLSRLTASIIGIWIIARLLDSRLAGGVK
ncbi:permease [Spirochaeta dissipatitropha]